MLRIGMRATAGQLPAGGRLLQESRGCQSILQAEPRRTTARPGREPCRRAERRGSARSGLPLGGRNADTGGPRHFRSGESPSVPGRPLQVGAPRPWIEYLALRRELSAFGHLLADRFLELRRLIGVVSSDDEEASASHYRISLGGQARS